MKIINALFVFVLLFAITYQASKIKSHTKQTFGDNYWLGDWECTGYRCGWSNYKELVNIVYEGNQVVATKKDSRGDNCVRTGKRTWWGPKPSTNSVGTKISSTWSVGNPSNPESGTVGGNTMIESETRFKDHPIVCERVGPYRPPAPAPVPRPVPGPTQYIPGQVQYIPGQVQYIPGQVQYIPGQVQYIPGQVQMPIYYQLPTVVFTYPATYFTGKWVVSGYVCNGAFAPLTIQVTVTGNQLQGLIVVGNACLGKNVKFITGTLPQVFRNNTPVTLNIIAPPNAYTPYQAILFGSNVFGILQSNYFFTKACK